MVYQSILVRNRKYKTHKKASMDFTCHEQKLEHLVMCFQKSTARGVPPGQWFSLCPWNNSSVA